MKEESRVNVLFMVGFAIFFLGLGWFLGKNFGDIKIEIWKLVLIIIGIVLIAFSLCQGSQKTTPFKAW